MNEFADFPTGLVNWQLKEHTGRIIELCLDVPGASLNTLGARVLEELETVLDWLEAQSPAGLILSSGKSSGFIAGADVKDFLNVGSAGEASEQITRVHAMFDRIEFAAFPSVV